jgi:hypothetical protein
MEIRMLKQNALSLRNKMELLQALDEGNCSKTEVRKEIRQNELYFIHDKKTG